jgi:hypothetical protein
LEIAHLHRVAFNVWSIHTGQQLAILGPKECMIFLEAATRLKGMAQFPLSFLRAEWETIIDPNAISTWEGYKSASRVGRGTPLGAKQRLVLWNVFAYVLDAMQAQGLLTWNRLCHEAAALLAQESLPPYDHVIVTNVRTLARQSYASCVLS